MSEDKPRDTSATPKREPRPERRVVEAKFVAGAARAAELPAPTVAEIAFAGRSNVGKSSLLNALLQRNGLARTSNTPGRTRQINLFAVTFDSGLAITFADLPGYGFARVSKAERASWGPLLEEYIATRATLRAVVLIVDVRRGLEADDEQLIDFVATCRPTPLPLIVVATKLDKLAPAKRKPAVAAVGAVAVGRKMTVIGFSADTGLGREELFRRIERAAVGGG